MTTPITLHTILSTQPLGQGILDQLSLKEISNLAQVDRAIYDLVHTRLLPINPFGSPPAGYPQVHFSLKDLHVHPFFTAPFLQALNKTPNDIKYLSQRTELIYNISNAINATPSSLPAVIPPHSMSPVLAALSTQNSTLDHEQSSGMNELIKAIVQFQRPANPNVYPILESTIDAMIAATGMGLNNCLNMLHPSEARFFNEYTRRWYLGVIFWRASTQNVPHRKECLFKILFSPHFMSLHRDMIATGFNHLMTSNLDDLAMMIFHSARSQELSNEILGLALTKLIDHSELSFALEILNSSRFSELPTDAVGEAFRKAPRAKSGLALQILEKIFHSDHFNALSADDLGQALCKMCCSSVFQEMAIALIHSPRFQEIPRNLLRGAFLEASESQQPSALKALLQSSRFQEKEFCDQDALEDALQYIIMNNDVESLKILLSYPGFTQLNAYKLGEVLAAGIHDTDGHPNNLGEAAVLLFEPFATEIQPEHLGEAFAEGAGNGQILFINSVINSPHFSAISKEDFAKAFKNSYENPLSPSTLEALLNSSRSHEITPQQVLEGLKASAQQGMFRFIELLLLSQPFTQLDIATRKSILLQNLNTTFQQTLLTHHNPSTQNSNKHLKTMMVIIPHLISLNTPSDDESED